MGCAVGQLNVINSSTCNSKKVSSHVSRTATVGHRAHFIYRNCYQ